MRLVVERQPTRYDATIGNLLVDGIWFCYTLEDTLREVPGQPVASWKIPKRTAIPAGTYQVVMTMSARFGRMLPLLLAVPGFDGIRIHPLNVSSQTEGCIGLGYDRTDRSIARSFAACEDLNDRIRRALALGRSVSIDVCNPVGYGTSQAGIPPSSIPPS